MIDLKIKDIVLRIKGVNYLKIKICRLGWFEDSGKEKIVYVSPEKYLEDLIHSQMFPDHSSIYVVFSSIEETIRLNPGKEHLIRHIYTGAGISDFRKSIKTEGISTIM